MHNQGWFLRNLHLISNWNLSGWFRVRIVGRDDEDRLRSFARRYLAHWNLLRWGTFLVGATPRGRPLPRHFAMVGLYNKFTHKSTYTRICAPSIHCINYNHFNSCHGRPHGVAPTRGCGALPQTKRKRRAMERHSRIQAFSVVPYNPQQSDKPKFK